MGTGAERVDAHRGRLAASIPDARRTSGTPPLPEWQFERLAACPICRHVEASTVLRRAVQGLPLEFSQCGHCGLIYQNPRLTRDSLADYFSSDFFIQDPMGDNLDELLGYPDYFDWDKSYRKTARLRLERIRKLKQPPGELLEIGPATGSFLDSARSFGFSVHRSSATCWPGWLRPAAAPCVRTRTTLSTTTLSMERRSRRNS